MNVARLLQANHQQHQEELIYLVVLYTDEICTNITHYLTFLMDFCRNSNLRLSGHKLLLSLFTIWMKEVRRTLNVNAEDNIILTIRYQRILGITFDNLLHFAAHATDINANMRRRNKVLKELAGTAWGMDKETIVTTYKAIERSLLNYVAPIWISFLTDTQWRAVQTSQNNALRKATGCVKMTSIDHLHEETSMLTEKKT